MKKSEIRIRLFHGSVNKNQRHWLEKNCDLQNDEENEDQYYLFDKKDLNAFVSSWKEHFLCYPDEDGSFDIWITNHPTFSTR